jgi:hypothetical protein
MLFSMILKKKETLLNMEKTNKNFNLYMLTSMIFTIRWNIILTNFYFHITLKVKKINGEINCSNRNLKDR